jgi:type IV pilus secretin PilQ/predicted competence protein
VVRASKLAYVQEGNIIRVDKLENLTKEAEAAFRAEQREVDIQQRRKEADLRIAQQERDAEAARQEQERKRQEQEREEERKRKVFEFETAPLAEEMFKLRYAHVGIKRVQTIDFFTDSIITNEERGIEEAISGGVKREEGKAAGLLSPRGWVTVDQRTNSLIVRDFPDNLARIREFIDRIDRPAPSVLIEARLVEMTRDDARSLGVIWGGAWTPRAADNGPIIDVKGAPPGGPVTGAVGASTPTTAANFPASVTSLTGVLAGATPFGLGLGWLASNFALDIQIQALEGQNRARILSAPTLMTIDNQPANVASGQKVPIISITAVAGAQQASVTFQDVTTRLQVTPRVVGDGRILLTIGVKDEVVASTVSAIQLTAPVVNTRSTVTQADVLDGGTVVIAGIRQESFQGTEQGVPWLSKVPVLGWLFKNDLTDTRRRELTVFLTAKIVPSPGQAAVPVPNLPAAPGAPAPPGPTGEAPTVTIPKTVLTPAATPPPLAGNGQQSAVPPKPVSAATLAPVSVPAGPSLLPAGER